MNCKGTGRVMMYPNKCSVCRLDLTDKVNPGRSDAPKHKPVKK